MIVLLGVACAVLPLVALPDISDIGEMHTPLHFKASSCRRLRISVAARPVSQTANDIGHKAFCPISGRGAHADAVLYLRQYGIQAHRGVQR